MFFKTKYKFFDKVSEEFQAKFYNLQDASNRVFWTKSKMPFELGPTRNNNDPGANCRNCPSDIACACANVKIKAGFRHVVF